MTGFVLEKHMKAFLPSPHVFSNGMVLCSCHYFSHFFHYDLFHVIFAFLWACFHCGFTC